MRKKFLITGGAGYLAPFLVQELRRRYPRASIVATHRRPKRGFVDCDLLDKPAVDRLFSRFSPDVVFHLAGTTKPASSRELERAHAAATINLLTAASRSSSRNRPIVVIAGSCGEYGRLGASRPALESSPERPITAYGKSKLAQTRASLSFRARGVDVRVARIFNLIGPGMPAHLAPGAFARKLAPARGIRRPVELAVGNLKSRRDFIDVRDTARALAAIASRGRSGEIYNVCSGRSTTIRRLLELMISETGARVVLKRLPPKPNDSPYVVGSYRKLNLIADWKPRVPLARSVRDMFAEPPPATECST